MARRTFAPVVLAGLAGSGAAALAGAKPWAHVSGAGASGVPTDAVTSLDAPAVTALALVALASWGVVLVTRGRVRRAVALLAAAAGAATVALGVVRLTSVRHTKIGWFSYAPSGASDPVPRFGISAWPWIALAGAAVTLIAAVLAFLHARDWPEMGRRYDAPTTGPELPANLEDAESIDLWKTISEGHDPTTDQD